MPAPCAEQRLGGVRRRYRDLKVQAAGFEASPSLASDQQVRARKKRNPAASVSLLPRAASKELWSSLARWTVSGIPRDAHPGGSTRRLHFRVTCNGKQLPGRNGRSDHHWTAIRRCRDADCNQRRRGLFPTVTFARRAPALHGPTTRPPVLERNTP